MGNLLQTAACEQAAFKSSMAENGYTTFTTFVSDLTIAEAFGLKGIQRTFDQVMKEWGNNIKYLTEFYMSINFKIWYWYKKNTVFANLYDSLFRQIDEYVPEHFNAEDRHYFYKTTD